MHYCEPITRTETNYGREVLFWFEVSAGYQSIMVGRHGEFLAIGVYGRVSTDYGGPGSQVSGVPSRNWYNLQRPFLNDLLIDFQALPTNDSITFKRAT